MKLVSPDPSVRTKFSQMRFIMAFTGGLIVQATTLPMVASFGASAEGVVKAELVESKVMISEQAQGSSRLEVSTLSSDYKDPSLVQKLGLQFGLVNEKDLGKTTKKKTIYVNTPEYYQEAGLSTGEQRTFEDIAYLTRGFSRREFQLNEIFKDVDLSDKTIEVQVINEQKGFSTTMTIFGFAAAILFVITFATTRARSATTLTKSLPWS